MWSVARSWDIIYWTNILAADFGSRHTTNIWQISYDISCPLREKELKVQLLCRRYLHYIIPQWKVVADILLSSARYMEGYHDALVNLWCCKMKWWCFRPLLCTLFRLNWAKQTPGIMCFTLPTFLVDLHNTMSQKHTCPSLFLSRAQFGLAYILYRGLFVWLIYVATTN